LGVLCRASSIFCRGSYISRHSFVALFFGDARFKYRILAVCGGQKGQVLKIGCVGYKESACDFDQDIGVWAG
jgi:hypothetical protein